MKSKAVIYPTSFKPSQHKPQQDGDASDSRSRSYEIQLSGYYSLDILDLFRKQELSSEFRVINGRNF